MKSKAKWLALATTIALFLLALWLYVQAVRPVKLVVSLVGFRTNAVAYTTSEGTFRVTSATFYISNLGRSKVVLNGFCRYEWMLDTKSFEGGIYWEAPELTGILSPGESKMASVTTHSQIRGPWRIAFNVSKYGWRHRFYAMDPWKQEFARGLVPEKWLLRSPSETVKSDWVGVSGLQR